MEHQDHDELSEQARIISEFLDGQNEIYEAGFPLSVPYKPNLNAMTEKELPCHGDPCQDSSPTATPSPAATNDAAEFAASKGGKPICPLMAGINGETLPDRERDDGYDSGYASREPSPDPPKRVMKKAASEASLDKRIRNKASPIFFPPDLRHPQAVVASKQQKKEPLSQRRLRSTPALELQPKPRLPGATIVTVELAAAAKVYLETHFNEILCGPTPRTRRTLHMENWLYKTKGFDTISRRKYREAFYHAESNHTREERVLKSKSMKALMYGDCSSKPSSVSLTSASDFQLLKILGKGSFGTVRLVREKAKPDDPPKVVKEKHNTVYAMKAIRKSEMIRAGQEGHLRAERDFLVASEGSNWVVPLVESFQDVSSLYLVMEYMPGGDFLSLLIRENILDEDVCRFYIAEMILCVEEVHAMQYIHRDIKPDNFLISASGHLKISDFGLAFDGHWSHDSRYYSSTRYSLLQHLNIFVEGDEADKAKDASLENPVSMSCSPGILAGLEKHQRQTTSDAGDEPILQ